MALADLPEYCMMLEGVFAAATRPAETFQAATQAALGLGFPYLIYAPVRNHPNAAKNWTATSYPDEWQRLYVEKNYLPRNPVRKHALVSSRPFRWSQLECALPKRERELFQDCRDVGMAEGVVVPVHGAWGQAVAIGFACHHRDVVTAPVLPALHLIALRLHYSFNSDDIAASTKLTPRERQILLRVAEGHENRQIADLLNIADSSVEWHLKNIFAKLAVNNRTAAVVKAIQNGILTY